MKPVQIKETSVAEMLASAKQKAEAFARLSDEEKVAVRQKQEAIFKKLHPSVVGLRLEPKS